MQYVTSAIYCIFFHPLAKYPGPFLAKFSGLPSFYHTYKGNRHVWLWQCHELYGESLSQFLVLSPNASPMNGKIVVESDLHNISQ